MPKFYNQNKKRIDPRYFMDEKLEEAVIEPGLTKAGSWPEDKTNAAMMSRATAAAERGQRVAAGEEDLPPWESEDSAGDGFTDVKLSESDYDILQWILKDLRIGAGTGNMAGKFVEVMEKLGISLDTSAGAPGMFDPLLEEEEASKVGNTLYFVKDGKIQGPAQKSDVSKTHRGNIKVVSGPSGLSKGQDCKGCSKYVQNPDKSKR